LPSTEDSPHRRAKRILVACDELVVAGGLYRFERFGRVIRRFDHQLAFLALKRGPLRNRATDFPVLTLEQAAGQSWDATYVPGAGFPPATVERFAELRADCFGVRVQHVLNDTTRRTAFLQVNHSFAPHVVIFNNRHWRPGQFIDFAAEAFHFLEGGVDLESLAPDPGRLTRQPGQRFTLGGLANKNPAPLLEAVRLCGPQVHLRLFGQPDGLAERARDLMASGRLHLEGLLDESQLPGFYAAVDGIAHTETFAGWANLAAEAMASGVPVICTPHGTGAFAEHEETALLVAEPSPEAIAGAILRLKNDPALAIHLARNARRRISAFSWTGYSADLLRLSERPLHSYYTWSPELRLFGKWPEEQRLHGLNAILEAAPGASICDLGAGDGAISRRLLERGAATVHGFELDAGRVTLANRLCADFAAARFRQADLSDWALFEAQHGKDMIESYDIVLYLGLHHHLPAAGRMRALMSAARRASRWFAVRTPGELFGSDDIERVLGELGFALHTAATDGAAGLGNSYVFTREPRSPERCG
jgi:glycosyltransferase involved in cell wall biosynthesis